MGYLRWVARAVGVIPVVGEQVGAGPDAIDLGASVATHATALLRIGEPLFAGSGGIAARAREVLVARGPELQREIAGLQADGVEAERLRRVRWMGPLQRAQRLVDGLAHDLAEAKTAGAIASAAATGLDPLLGFDQRRTYVVLGQNEQEIRANGGYTGTMGVVVIERGRLVSSEYRSSVEFDPPKLPNRRPPQSLSQSMGAGLWMVRDAAWDPDFPVSAERVLQFLKEDQGIEADGVIAVNTPMIQLLLRATGPVTVEGFSEQLTADNFLAQLEEEIFEAGTDSVSRKRQLLQPVLRTLIGRVQDAGADQVPRLIAAFTKGAGGRDLQVYSREPRSTALLRQFRVDGSLQPVPEHDMLAVVDSNISYNKIQSAILRDITYLARADGKVDLLVRWTNERSSFTGTRYSRLGQGGQIWDPVARKMNDAPGTFGNYVRIYLPRGTTFDFIDGFSRPPGLEVLSDFSLLSGLILVPDGKTVSLRLTYTPGGNAERATAQGLVVWKQGGQQRDQLRVVVNAGQQQISAFEGAFERDLVFDAQGQRLARR